MYYDKYMHLAVVIPAYNEAKVLGDVLNRLPKRVYGVRKITAIVIDDNSSDDTSGVAKSCGAMCVRHQMNLGAGGATITGFEAAKQINADIIVTMDGDAQHDPEEIKDLIRPILKGEADVVLGSRLMTTAGNMSHFKRFGNNLMNVITFAFFRIWVTDSQSGYKAFSRRAVEKLELRTSGYEFCSEIIGEIKRHRMVCREIPISTIYTDYSKAKGQLAINGVNIILGLALRKLR